jgi:hypothetical protein
VTHWVSNFQIQLSASSGNGLITSLWFDISQKGSEYVDLKQVLVYHMKRLKRSIEGFCKCPHTNNFRFGEVARNVHVSGFWTAVFVIFYQPVCSREKVLPFSPYNRSSLCSANCDYGHETTGSKSRTRKQKVSSSNARSPRPLLTDGCCPEAWFWKPKFCYGSADFRFVVGCKMLVSRPSFNSGHFGKRQAMSDFYFNLVYFSSICMDVRRVMNYRFVV